MRVCDRPRRARVLHALFATGLAVSCPGCLVDRSDLVDGVSQGPDARSSDLDAALDASGVVDAAAEAPDAVAEAPDAWAAPDSGCNGADGDGDGLRDPCDPWPCGETPEVSDTVVAESIRITGVSVAGDGRTTVVRSGGAVAVALDWFIDDAGCGGCIDQIEIGTVPGDRSTCVFDANPAGGGESGGADVALSMPVVAVPTRVDLRFNLSQDYACDRHASWWDAAPGDAQTIAAFCVVP